MAQECTKCKQIKPIGDFHTFKSRKGEVRRRRECKVCMYARMRKWEQDNIDHVRKRRLASYHKNKDRTRKLLRERYARDKEYRNLILTRSKRYRSTPEARIVERTRKKATKDAAFAAYGGYRCQGQGCGITDPELLNIDHEGGRKKHNHVPKMRGDWLYSWLRSHNYPPGFRVLCFNCNVKAYHNDRTKKYS